IPWADASPYTALFRAFFAPLFLKAHRPAWLAQPTVLSAVTAITLWPIASSVMAWPPLSLTGNSYHCLPARAHCHARQEQVYASSACVIVPSAWPTACVVSAPACSHRSTIGSRNYIFLFC